MNPKTLHCWSITNTHIDQASETIEKSMYEDEAQESDNDFIDDSDVDESDSDAVDLAKQFSSKLKNRKSWMESSSTCPTCRCVALMIPQRMYTLFCIELQARGLPHIHVIIRSHV